MDNTLIDNHCGGACNTGEGMGRSCLRTRALHGQGRKKEGRKGELYWSKGGVLL